MRLGVGSYTYGWASGTYGPGLTTDLAYLSAYDLVDRAAGYGLGLVQIVVRPALDAMTDSELTELAAYAVEKNVAIETGTSGSDPEVLRRWLHASAFLGARVMRTLFADATPHLEREKACLREVLPEFRDAGVAVAIENHEAYSCRDLLALVEELGDGVGVCLDTVNSLGRGEGVREVADALLPRTISLHVKDFRATRGGTDMGFAITGAVTGEGRLDVPWLLGAMRRHDPDVGVILEQWTPIVDSVEDAIGEQERWADKGVVYLKRVLADLEQSR